MSTKSVSAILTIVVLLSLTLACRAGKVDLAAERAVRGDYPRVSHDMPPGRGTKAAKRAMRASGARSTDEVTSDQVATCPIVIRRGKRLPYELAAETLMKTLAAAN